MDIEEFYDENPRRRTSEELEYGREWHDAEGNRYAVSWVRDTGELYAMREPVEPMVVDGAGDEFVPRMPTEIVTVEVLGRVATLEGVERLLAGWPDQMTKPNSLQWVRDRLAQHADSTTDGVPGAET